MVVFLNVLLSIMTFGMFTLAEVSHDGLSINEPIEELNGLTIKEVFEDGNLKTNNDFKGGTTQWVVSGDFVVNNDVFEWTATTNFQNGLIGYLNIGSNKNYYIASYVKSDINYNYTQRLYDVATSTTLVTFNFIGTGSYKIDSFIFNSQIDGQIEYRPLRNQTYSSDFKTIYLEEVVFIELDVLGIDHLTKEQIDYYYSIYEMGGYHDVSYTINEVDLTDIVIIVSSAFIWLFFIRFIKEVL